MTLEEFMQKFTTQAPDTQWILSVCEAPYKPLMYQLRTYIGDVRCCPITYVAMREGHGVMHDVSIFYAVEALGLLDSDTTIIAHASDMRDDYDRALRTRLMQICGFATS